MLVQLDSATFKRLIREGQGLRKQFDRETASVKVLTAEDYRRVSR